MAARECALGFRAPSRRAWWPRALEDESRCPHREPAGNRRRGDGRPAAAATESACEKERRWDVAARKPEHLERPLSQFDASIVVSPCPVVGSAIEWRWLLE